MNSVARRGNPGSPANPRTPATNLFYAGEQWDNSAKQYYLRARYYNPLNGRFNRMDSFAGSPQDPQSLHKYLYCHANPVNMIDPSGRMGLPGIIALVILAAVLATILTIALVPPLYKLRRVSQLVQDSEEMDSETLEGAIDAGDIYWSANSSWGELRSIVDPDAINPLMVMVTPLDKRIGGFHLYFKQGYVFVSQNAVYESSLATAFTIFAEWTHDRWLAGGLNEENAQKELDSLIELLPEEEQKKDYISNYGHHWF